LYSYIEFTIAIRRGRVGSHGDRVTVECVKPDGGQAGPTDAQRSTTSIARLTAAANAEQRIDLGDALGSSMFPPPVLAAFYETLGTLDKDTGVRLRLLCPDAEMARWPWELARIKTPLRRPRYLFRDERFSLVRTLTSSQPVHSPKERPKLIILTADATRVPGEQELVPDFPAELPGTESLEWFTLSRPTRKSIDELIDQIADGPHPLDIFHFTGHGRPPRNGQAGALVLYREDDTGAHHYRGDELAGQLASAGTSLAFVNACYSDDQPVSGDWPGVAQSLAEVVPVVVAMRGAVGDRVARDFADVFYDWLLRGSTVDEAVARGRLELEESLPDWGRVVLYSRASSGRFLEPVPQAAEPAPPALPLQPVPDGIRRWGMAAGVQGHWQLVPGEAGPEFRRVVSGTAADITHLRMVTASLAVSCDARVVAELNRGRLALAWVDRVLPRLDRWPKSFELPLDGQETRLLAVAVDYGDEVVCLLSTDRATYRVEASPSAEPIVTEIFDTPTRCATIVAGSMLTVDGNGRLRGWELNLSNRGIAEVSSLDAARSAGRAVYAVAGRDDVGRPIVAEGNSIDTLAVLPSTTADEVVVVRQLSGAHAPNQALLATGEQLERIPVGDAP
jgi:CHAT domain